MSSNYKTSFKAYTAWNYEREIEDLNKASEKGWQLVKGGCFHSRFVKNPDVHYRYQLDFGRIEDMGRYIETFREQGWEYINSTFNGWHYFRKLYDPSQPEESYEIFTDRESLHEMNNRWARLALILGIILAAFAVFYAVRSFTHLTIPSLIRFFMFLIESALLLRGWFIMRNPESSRNRRGDGAIFAIFLSVIILGAGISIILEGQRPHMWTTQQASSIDQPIIDNRWNDFDVKYADNYYLDLKLEAPAPMTFEIVNDAGEAVFTQTATAFDEKNIRLKLPRGHYQFSISCTTGYYVYCDLD